MILLAGEDSRRDVLAKITMTVVAGMPMIFDETPFP